MGRTVGIVLFWLLLCYVIGMSARSIIPSLFWPGLAPRAEAPALKQCLREIRELDQELASKAAATLRSGQPGRISHWLHAWDERYLALTGGCGPLEGAREDLGTLRTELESLLRSYQGGALRTRERIERAVVEIGADRGSE
jgi:hypothetical protein